MMDKFVKEYAAVKGYNVQEWGVLSDLVKDGLISTKQARDFLIRKHYIEQHQLHGCMETRRRLAKRFEVSVAHVRLVTT